MNINPIIVVCINEALGNMDAGQAAYFINQYHAESTIPVHFWLFAEHVGPLVQFIECVVNESSNINAMRLTPGRAMPIYGKELK